MDIGKSKSNIQRAIERGEELFKRLYEEKEEQKKTLSGTEWLVECVIDNGFTYKRQDIIVILERNDIEINRKFNSWTCLQLAVANGHPELVIKKMIDLKADVNAINNDGRAAISYVTRRNREILELLLNHGADINIGNNQELFKQFPNLRVVN